MGWELLFWGRVYINVVLKNWFEMWMKVNGEDWMGIIGGNGLLILKKEELCRYVAAVSSVTHTSDITLAGASMIAMAVASALEYHDREKMIEDALSVEEYAMNLGASTPSPSLGARTKLGILLAQTYANDETAFLENIYNVIGAGVNTSESVPAALAIAYYSFDVRKCALLCANLGGDTDTIGAMAAAICGAAQGLSEIPEKDIALIQKSNQIDFTKYADAIIKKRGQIKWEKDVS